MKIRSKLLLLLCAAAFVLALLAAAYAGSSARSAALAREVERLRGVTALLASAVAEAGPADRWPALAQEHGRDLGLRITLIAADGTVLGDSARQPSELAGMENHLDRAEVRAAAERGSGWALHRSRTFETEFLYVAQRVERAGAVRFVRAALPSQRLLDETVAVRKRTFFLVLGASLLLVAGAYLGARRLSRPIEGLAEAVERMALGQPDRAPLYDGRDEVGRLASALERMKSSLTQQLAAGEEERRLLLSVLGGMREGLLLVGPDRRIRLANEAFRQIFALPFDPTGRLLAEVIRDPTVLKGLEAARSEEREVRDDAFESASGRSFQLHVTPLAGPRGGAPGDMLCLFLDVTRTEALESVRREFVANVSHELRTPLTSIKAFVETLLDGGLHDDADRVKFLEIVRKHADRMGALIDDLTDLSLIETGAIALHLQPVDVGELARDVAENLAPRAARLEVGLRVDLPDGFRVRADRMRLEQVLVNLMENGVKFNRPGGLVTVSGGEVDGRPVVTVADTGVGIPGDSIERVFHRFFRVDKARSKDLGGTGLGLSIVKHLMRLHGGQVRVESEVGLGSKFFLEFPPDA